MFKTINFETFLKMGGDIEKCPKMKVTYCDKNKGKEISREPFDGDFDFFEQWVKQTAIVSRVAEADNLIIERI